MALAFPNTYWVGMSNLGFQTVYRLFNDQPDIVCERVFLPPKQELAAQLASGTPLVTLESQTPVRDFDVFAFSVSFEWDYVNVLTLLRLAGVPRYAAERTRAHPLVVDRRRRDLRESGAAGAVCRRDRGRRRRGAGAVAASARFAKPTGRADAAALPRRASAASTSRRSTSRATATTAARPAIAALTGADAPVPVRKAAVKTTDALDPPATSIFTPDTEFGSRLLVEVVRGCANLCRFCWAGYNYLPVRVVSGGPHSAARTRRAAARQPRADSCRSRSATTRRSSAFSPVCSRWAT